MWSPSLSPRRGGPSPPCSAAFGNLPGLLFARGKAQGHLWSRICCNSHLTPPHLASSTRPLWRVMWNAKRPYKTAKRPYETATAGGGVPDTVARPWEAGQGMQASAPVGGRRTGFDIIVGHTRLYLTRMDHDRRKALKMRGKNRANYNQSPARDGRLPWMAHDHGSPACSQHQPLTTGFPSTPRPTPNAPFGREWRASLRRRWLGPAPGGLRRWPWRAGSFRCRIWGTARKKDSLPRRGRCRSRSLSRSASRRRP